MSGEPYAPTTADVRGAASRGVGGDGFDRWIAEHDRQVAEAARRDALEEAATALMDRPYVRGGFDFTEDAASFIRDLIGGER